MKLRKEYDEEKIKNVVVNSETMSEAARILNIPISTFKRICIRLNVYNPSDKWNTTKYIHSNKSRETQAKNNLVQLNNILTGESIFTGASRSLKDRLIKFNILLNKCAECGIESTWNYKPIILQLDHIDGNHSNNVLNNLRILCPNCHSQTPTFAGRNITTKSINRFLHIEDKIKEFNPSTISELLQKIGVKPSPYYYKKVNKILINKQIDTKIRKKCITCDKFISNKTKHGLCQKCMHITQFKCKHPSKSELIQQLKNTSILAIGTYYGVSDNAIRKWMKNYEIPIKKVELREYLRTVGNVST